LTHTKVFFTNAKAFDLHVNMKNIPYSLLFCLFFLTAKAQPQTDALPRSIPEDEGVSSAGILCFLEAAGKSKHEFHSFMMLRHGKVVAEGCWNPYRPDLKNTLYSTSKSFSSTLERRTYFGTYPAVYRKPAYGNLCVPVRSGRAVGGHSMPV